MTAPAGYKLRAVEAEASALRYIVQYLEAVKYPPKLAEIAAGQAPPWSKSKTHLVVRRLAEKGFLEVDFGEPRGIRVLRPVEELELERARLEGAVDGWENA
jgi:SOS-response transcriptional repressor LexA